MNNNKIYILDIKVFDNKEIYDYWYNKVSNERKIKVDNCVREKDKKLSLGAGVLLHIGLEALNVSKVLLAYKKNGKPYILNSDIHFNISHTSDLVVCVFSDKEIGVDIEIKRKFNDNFINKIFNSQEIEYINNRILEKDFMCTKLWTIKESYMKYLGDGITLDPKNIKVDISNEEDIKIIESNVYFKIFTINNYNLTICSQYKDFPNKIEWVKNLNIN